MALNRPDLCLVSSCQTGLDEAMLELKQDVQKQVQGSMQELSDFQRR
jgi:hypothetical protein